MRGFDDNYFAPHSRYTEVRLEDIKKHPDLIPLAVSDLAGLHIVTNQSGRQILSPGTRSTTGTPWPRSISGT